MQKLFKSFPDPSIFYYTHNQEDGSDDPFLKENGITQNRPPDSGSPVKSCVSNKTKTSKTSFVLEETLSLMLWMQAWSCEPAHRPSLHPHHQSLWDTTRTKEKPRKKEVIIYNYTLTPNSLHPCGNAYEEYRRFIGLLLVFEVFLNCAAKP